MGKGVVVGVEWGEWDGGGGGRGGAMGAHPHIRVISESYPSRIRVISESYPSHIRTHIRDQGRGRRPRVCPAAGALKLCGYPKGPFSHTPPPEAPPVSKTALFERRVFAKAPRPSRPPPLFRKLRPKPPETPPRKLRPETPPGNSAPEAPRPSSALARGHGRARRRELGRVAPLRARPGSRPDSRPGPGRNGPARNGMGRQRVDCARRGRAAP